MPRILRQPFQAHIGRTGDPRGPSRDSSPKFAIQPPGPQGVEEVSRSRSWTARQGL